MDRIDIVSETDEMCFTYCSKGEDGWVGIGSQKMIEYDVVFTYCVSLCPCLSQQRSI